MWTRSRPKERGWNGCTCSYCLPLRKERLFPSSLPGLMPRMQIPSFAESGEKWSDSLLSLFLPVVPSQFSPPFFFSFKEIHSPFLSSFRKEGKRASEMPPSLPDRDTPVNLLSFLPCSQTLWIRGPLFQLKTGPCSRSSPPFPSPG